MKVRTEARRVAIVEVAASVFLEMGYEGASMLEVSKRLGGSKATLYGYFPSKESLFVAVVQMYTTSHLYEAVSGLFSGAAADEGLEPQLLKFAQRMLMVVMNDTTAIKVYRMIVAESGRSDIGLLFHETGPSQCIDGLATLMSAAMSRGELRQATPGVRAKQFLALVTAEVNDRLFQQEPTPMTASQIETIAGVAVDMFMRGGGASTG